MRSSVSFLLFIIAVKHCNEIEVTTTTNAQNQNLGGTTHFPISYPQYYEDSDLTAEQFFYFDIDLLKEIAHENREGNILISPLSIKSTLAMILEGAANESANELRMALHLPDNKRVRDQFRKLLTEFEHAKPGVHLQMANRIFLSKNLSPLDKYRDILTQYYYSNVTKVDFTSPAQSAATINAWVNQKTHGIIPTLVDEGSFGGETSILLANALYFKGMWEKSFSELGTKTSCFYLSNGECQNTPTMDVVDNFKYDEVKHLDAKVIEIPYTGGEYSMVIVLPNRYNGIQQLTRDIRTSINTIVRNLNETEVYISLPRFKIDYSTDLIDYLPKVHITNVIGPKAVLTGIVADVAVRVSNVLHKTHIDVNEQGTVAAAATGAVVIPLMGTTKPRFKADHPFLFFIRHTSTGTILFEGRLSQPERSFDQPQNNRPTQPQRQQPALQRPVQQQSAFLNPQNSFVAQPQPTANTFSSQAQNSFQTQPQNAFQTQPNFQNPQEQQRQSLFQSTRQHVLQHIPDFKRIIPQNRRQQSQQQSDDVKVNDLKNNEQVNPMFVSNSESENARIYYEDGLVNNKQHQ